MESKAKVSLSFVCLVCQDIFDSPYTLKTCGHSFCEKCLIKVQKFSILKPNYSPNYFRCPLCSRITDIPSGDFKQDIPYAEEIELAIREWREKEFKLDEKYSVADICKNHLKILEKFCLDDNHFICWMCHNFNYSDEHRGHKVVGLPEAYQIIKKQSIANLDLLERMKRIVDDRIKYASNCRHIIEADCNNAKISLNEYIDKIISDLNALRERKIQELDEEHTERDAYMLENIESLEALSDEVQNLLRDTPETLHGVLKKYKSTTGFIKTLTNSIIFPTQTDVNIKLEIPKYEKIKRIITECETAMTVSSVGLPENVIKLINPLIGSKIIPEKEQTDMILNVLPNFKSAELAYRLSDDKFLGQHFRNRVYNKGPTLTIISANKGHIFGGYSPISWTEGTDNNWRTSDDSFIFTLTDNQGRQPEKIFLEKNRQSTALFHSRISYAFGSGHDLSINLIDLKRCESALFSYAMPKSSTTDANKFLAGRRDKWDVDELEVFLIDKPINQSRYESMQNSLHYIAKKAMVEDGLLSKEDAKAGFFDFRKEEEKQDQQKEEEKKEKVVKSYHNEEKFDAELPEEQDSILDHSFLYKDLIKDEHLMTKQEVIERDREEHQQKSTFLQSEL
ncbi:unnamed protein product [Moneuplotes crassus]|uniref:Uncharacterized protein n=1 Tax=Euplotes crassus TaxID=5936 RepID=A0AAD1U2V5_EUPCR|nr:unnamed protein product [Moneuplotes crassus]